MKISKEVYDELVGWKNDFEYFGLLYPSDISNLYNNPVINRWWVQLDTEDINSPDNRLIAIIRWVNGEDVFEVEKPKKWVVRSKDTDEIGSYWYVLLHVGTVDGRTFDSNDATKFDTKEEAESWANAHQEVIEVEE